MKKVSNLEFKNCSQCWFCLPISRRYGKCMHPKKKDFEVMLFQSACRKFLEEFDTKELNL